MTVAPASTLPPFELLDLFNRGYSDYLVPLQLDATQFEAHLTSYDVDLECSAVVLDPDPAAVALIARRGTEAWIAGVGTAPEHRRRGLGAQAMRAALQGARAQGASRATLEVIVANARAIALYEALGFRVARDLLVWSLPAGGQPPPDARPVSVAEAQAWIAGHRASPEPWQRAPGTVAAIAAHGGRIAALVLERGPSTQAAVVWHEQGARSTVLQIAAGDAATAADALRAAAGRERALRLTNVESDDPASQAMEALGAELVAAQHEMALVL